MSLLSSKFLGMLTVTALSIGILAPIGSPSAQAVIDLDVIGVNYDYGSSAEVQIDTSIDLDNNLLNTGTNTSATVTSDESVNVNEEGNFAGGQVINVTRSEVKANDNESERVDISPKAVLITADLKAYAATLMRSDISIDEMNFTEKTVEVKYKEEGQLLALIPITFTVNVVANADGSVEVNYPWYSIITVDKKDDMEAKIKIAVDNALRAHLVGSVKAEGKANHTLSVSEAAEIAAQIHAVLKASSIETGD